MKRARGTGSIFRPKNSKFYYVKYYSQGRAVRESTGTEDASKAQKYLSKRLAEVLTDKFLGPQLEKITVDDLAADLLREYKVNNRHSLPGVESKWRLHLQPYFGLRRVVGVTSGMIDTYIDKRQKQGAPNASINRELAVLKRAFNLAVQSAKINRVPHVAHLKEDNTRLGFVEDVQYQKLAAESGKIGLWLRSLVECGYQFGFRRGELVSMKARQVDLSRKTIRLEVGSTKSGEGRQVCFDGIPALETLLTACCVGKGPDDLVFCHENGGPIGDFRKLWANVTAAAGVSGLLFHDLRRTAVRRMVRAGIPEHVAMQISGHRTRSVFDRYDIVSEGDLRDAARKLGMGSEKFGTEFGTESENKAVVVAN